MRVAVVVATMLVAAGCSGGVATPGEPSVTSATTTTTLAATTTSAPTTSTTTVPQNPIPSEVAETPEEAAVQFNAVEDAIRDPATTSDDMAGWGKFQQSLLARLGARAEWDEVVAALVREEYRPILEHHMAIRRWVNPNPPTDPRPPPDELPAWTIIEPQPLETLVAHYQAAEAATGAPWQYLAAINFIETRFGRIIGDSSAGAQGPMQFIPSTWAQYGEGGDVWDPEDAIHAAARLLVNFGAPGDMVNALWHYNPSDRYINSVSRYAEIIESEPRSLEAFVHWEVFYGTSQGAIRLPVGYDEDQPVPVEEYLNR